MNLVWMRVGMGYAIHKLTEAGSRSPVVGVDSPLGKGLLGHLV